MTDSSDYPLTPIQQRAWLNYMRVYHRLEYEMNHHLRAECGLSLYDYTVLNALSRAPDRRLQVTSLATVKARPSPTPTTNSVMPSGR